MFNKQQPFDQNSILESNKIEIAIFSDGLYFMLNNKKHTKVCDSDIEIVKNYIKMKPIQTDETFNLDNYQFTSTDTLGALRKEIKEDKPAELKKSK